MGFHLKDWSAPVIFYQAQNISIWLSFLVGDVASLARNLRWDYRCGLPAPLCSPAAGTFTFGRSAGWGDQTSARSLTAGRLSTRPPRRRARVGGFLTATCNSKTASFFVFLLLLLLLRAVPLRPLPHSCYPATLPTSPPRRGVHLRVRGRRHRASGCAQRPGGGKDGGPGVRGPAHLHQTHQLGHAGEPDAGLQGQEKREWVRLPVQKLPRASFLLLVFISLFFSPQGANQSAIWETQLGMVRFYTTKAIHIQPHCVRIVFLLFLIWNFSSPLLCFRSWSRSRPGNEWWVALNGMKDANPF